MKDNGAISIETLKELHKRKVPFEVSILEKELITTMRETPYGKVIIQMMDGTPFRMQLEISKFFEGGQDFDILKKIGGDNK